VDEFSLAASVMKGNSWISGAMQIFFGLRSAFRRCDGKAKEALLFERPTGSELNVQEGLS
jgi:hypothetical protein